MRALSSIAAPDSDSLLFLRTRRTSKDEQRDPAFTYLSSNPTVAVLLLPKRSNACVDRKYGDLRKLVPRPSPEANACTWNR